MIKNLQKLNFYPQPYILNLPSLIFKILFQPITNTKRSATNKCNPPPRLLQKGINNEYSFVVKQKRKVNILCFVFIFKQNFVPILFFYCFATKSLFLLIDFKLSQKEGDVVKYNYTYMVYIQNSSKLSARL